LFAAVCGLVAATTLAPVGNRVALQVIPQAPDEDTRVAAAALEAELTRQLRAMKLDVGGPPDGVTPATHVRVRLWLRAHPTVAFASVVSTDVEVDVVDDDAGGTAHQEALGFGESRCARPSTPARTRRGWTWD